ncbi:hypothetical protein EG328_009040 [Venturia inaequalis]|uniref:Uncharacterized protein n=1 Tax=Venturia inaequalis TaxID=5025 RepID=A0A8H3VSB8_VENIN|nr:hypothetical protein EG328_009040 [Venturia inaequalis]KAE9994130.1 hypothetical protein EG327_001202 [Venturia inaequalis]
MTVDPETTASIHKIWDKIHTPKNNAQPTFPETIAALADLGVSRYRVDFISSSTSAYLSTQWDEYMYTNHVSDLNPGTIAWSPEKLKVAVEEAAALAEKGKGDNVEFCRKVVQAGVEYVKAKFQGPLIHTTRARRQKASILHYPGIQNAIRSQKLEPIIKTWRFPKFHRLDRPKHDRIPSPSSHAIPKLSGTTTYPLSFNTQFVINLDFFIFGFGRSDFELDCLIPGRHYFVFNWHSIVFICQIFIMDMVQFDRVCLHV